MAGTYQLTITGSCAGEFMQNILHFHLNEAGAGTLFEYAEALINAFNTSNLNDFLGMLSPDYSCLSLRAKKVSGSGGPTAILGFAAGSQIGGGGTSAGSTQVALLLNFPVALNGKNVTGKMFISGIPAAEVVDNTMSNTLQTAAGTWMTTLFTNLTLTGALGTATFCIYNRATQTDQVVSAGYVSPLVGTQRRRLHPV